MILNTIADLAALGAMDIPSDNHVHVLGYNTPADGGGGDFYWDATSTALENGGTIFDCLATAAPTPPATLTIGKWIRYYSESINVKWFGATGDGITNDSPAFQGMIDFCEPAGIKDVVIPFGDFYLDESVHVKIGGIKFIGQGSLLREESYSGNANSYKGSRLIIKENISGIVYDPSVTDSAYWRGVEFFAKEGRTIGNTYAIDFRVISDGLVWPFNVHECHFNGFNRVFNFDGGKTLYNVAFVNITHCGFVENDEVFYQGFGTIIGEGEDQVDNSNNRFLCWGFNFQHNKCHHNSRVIYGYFAYDLVTISDNNMEGNNDYADGSTPSYIVDIEIDNCAVKFHGNHFEGVLSDCVSISSLRKNQDGTYKPAGGTTAGKTCHYVDIYGNNHYGVQENYKPYTLSACVVKINELTPIYVHACEILENGNSNIGLTDYALENGTIIKFTNQEWLSSNFIKGLCDYRFLRNPSEQAFLDEKGEQWVREKSDIFNMHNGYNYDASNVKFCINVYKVKNYSQTYNTNSSGRYLGSEGAGAVFGTLYAPFGESLVVCVFPSNIAEFGNSFTTAMEFSFSAPASIEVCSSVFSYLTDSESPEIIPVFESSNVVSEVGTFEAGQTWFNGTELRRAISSGTAGTLGIVTISASSGNKIQLSDISKIAQGQFINVGGVEYRIIELRGAWATLDAIPTSVSGYVTFVAPTFSTIIDDNNIDDYAILNQNASAQTANGWISGNFIADGKIGIGTSSPAYKLDVAGYTISQNIILSRPDGNAQVVYRNNGTDSWVTGISVGNGTEDYNLYNYDNATIAMTVQKATNNVGIKNSNPGQSLDVDGTIRQSSVTSAMLKANSSGDIVAATGGTDYVASEIDPVYTAAEFMIIKQRHGYLGAGNGLSLASNTGSEHGFAYADGADGAGFAGAYIDFGGLNTVNYHNQLIGDYVTGSIFKIRTNNADGTPTWNPWRTLLHDANVSSYAIQNQNSSAQTANAWISGNFITNGKIGIGTSTPAQSLDVSGTIRQSAVTSAMLKANSSGDIVAAVAGTDYMAPTTLTSGTYMPTVSAISGISDNYTVKTFTYTRVGDIVHVSGTIIIAPASYINPLRAMNVSLPIASSISVEYDIAGVGSGRNDNGQIIEGATVCGDAANDNALVTYEASDSVTLYLQFDYTVL